MITHTDFIVSEFIAQLHRTSVTQGFLAEFSCVIRGLHKVLSVNVLITHINCLGMNFPIARTFGTQKGCFRILCVIISVLIVYNLLAPLQGSFGPFGPEIPKKSKKFPGPLGPGVKKVEKCRKRLKDRKKVVFDSFLAGLECFL